MPSVCLLLLRRVRRGGRVREKPTLYGGIGMHAVGMGLGSWDLGAAVEHPSKEADVSGNATRYLERQRLFPRRACLHSTNLSSYTQHLREVPWKLYIRQQFDQCGFSAMTATPETTLWYTIKPRAFRRDYIRKQIEMYSCYYLLEIHGGRKLFKVCDGRKFSRACMYKWELLNHMCLIFLSLYF